MRAERGGDVSSYTCVKGTVERFEAGQVTLTTPGQRGSVACKLTVFQHQEVRVGRELVLVGDLKITPADGDPYAARLTSCLVTPETECPEEAHPILKK